MARAYATARGGSTPTVRALPFAARSRYRGPARTGKVAARARTTKEAAVKKLALVLALFLIPLACAEKVDCAKMKSKLDECGAALAKKLVAEQGGAAAAAVGSISDGMLQSIISSALQPINKQCTDNGGKFSDAKAMNECLAKATCDDFAACMVAHVK
jgi:hypothetical protein